MHWAHRIGILIAGLALAIVILFLWSSPTDDVLPAPRNGGQAAEGSEPPIDTMTPPPPPPAPEPEVAEPIILEPMMMAPDDATEIREVPIYWATNRTPQAQTDPDDLTTAFSDVAGDVTWGEAVITIPPHHEMGELESQGWLASLIFDPDPEKHVTVQSMSIVEDEILLGMIAADLASDENAILMYVHGYNTSFDKALRRTGQLTYDLAWQGPSVLFSWPSQGTAAGYIGDGNQAERSRDDLIEVLQELTALNPERFVIIGHSMGTRIVSQAVAEIVREGDLAATKLTTIILAAPDIDKQLFMESLAPRFAQLEASHVTLYASSEDAALKASRSANRGLRIGDTTGGVPVIEGIDVIDASDTVSDFFGHTYFGDNETILSDIYRMIHEGLPIHERPTISQVDGPPPFWKIIVD